MALLKLLSISVSCSESHLSYEASLHFSASEKQSIPMSLSTKKLNFFVSRPRGAKLQDA